MSDDSGVTHLVIKDREGNDRQFKLIEKTWDQKYCKHLLVLIDEHEKTIQCRKCKAPVDPFEWILNAAITERRIYQEASRVDSETKDRRKAIEELKRIERNLKSRIRNASKRLENTHEP